MVLPRWPSRALVLVLRVWCFAPAGCLAQVVKPFFDLPECFRASSGGKDFGSTCLWVGAQGINKCHQLEYTISQPPGLADRLSVLIDTIDLVFTSAGRRKLGCPAFLSGIRVKSLALGVAACQACQSTMHA